ncbi:MAG: response regulator transcription factor [Spirochaetaceae bacterium]
MTCASLASLEATAEDIPSVHLSFLTAPPSVEEAITSTALLVGAEHYLLREAELRALQRALPVLVLGSPESLPSAFALGCSDYLRDPWSPEELFVRLRSRAGRISRTLFGEPLTLSGERLEGESGEVTLEPGEARVLRALMLAPGVTVDRRFLSLLLGLAPALSSNSRALDARISRLRKKVKPLLSNALQEKQVIRAVYGGGYRLECG